MRPFVTPLQARDLDRTTISTLRISSFELMQKVSKEIADRFETRENLKTGSVLILCGPGNNGGDGYCLAEYLRQRGRQVIAFEVQSAGSPDCQKARAFYQGRMSSNIPKADIIVDAIYGSNGRSDLSSAEALILREVNRKASVRVALDVSTGVDAETSRAHPDTFCADLSLVVAWPKMSMLSQAVVEYLGAVEFIGNYFAQPRSAKIFSIEPKDFTLPKRKPTGFKNLYGRCGIVGGASSMPGAAILAAEAAHRFGAGYSTIYFAKPGVLKLKVKDAGFLLKTQWKSSELKKESVLVLGCGGFVKNFSWSSVTKSMVIDAEGLLHWKKFSKLKAPAILTPHPGEAAKMLSMTTAEVQRDRMKALKDLSDMTKQTVYLKGAPGLLKFNSTSSVDGAVEDNSTYVNLSINSIFSKAGSGDVLAGVLGGALAQMSDFKAAVLTALAFQAEVGEILREREATIVSDQLEVFSEAFKRLRTSER